MANLLRFSRQLKHHYLVSLVLSSKAPNPWCQKMVFEELADVEQFHALGDLLEVTLYCRFLRFVVEAALKDEESYWTF